MRTSLNELDAFNGRVGNEINSVVSVVATTTGTISPETISSVLFMFESEYQDVVGISHTPIPFTPGM